MTLWVAKVAGALLLYLSDGWPLIVTKHLCTGDTSELIGDTDLGQSEKMFEKRSGVEKTANSLYLRCILQVSWGKS